MTIGPTFIPSNEVALFFLIETILGKTFFLVRYFEFLIFLDIEMFYIISIHIVWFLQGNYLVLYNTTFRQKLIRRKQKTIESMKKDTNAKLERH